MPSTLEQLNPTRVKLTITIPFNELKPEIEQTYKSIAQQVNIPGFRKGKVPARLIDQRFGRELVLQEALNSLLPRVYAQAVEENELTVMSQPSVDIDSLKDDEDAVVTAEVDVCPPFELPDASEVSVEVNDAQVSDEDLTERVDLLRKRFANRLEVERAAKADDIVTLNLKATKDGEVLPDGEAKEIQYQIGSGAMIEGIDQAVTGLKQGQQATFTSQLLAGKSKGVEAEIEVEVVKVYEEELPEVDDEFASMVSSFDTVDEMTADLKEGIQRSKLIEQTEQARSKVLEYLIENTKIELPESAITAEQEAGKQNVTRQLEAASMTLEQYLENSDLEYKDADEFWQALAQEDEKRLRGQLILDKLAKQEDVEVSREDITNMVVAQAQQTGIAPEKIMAQMMQNSDQMSAHIIEIRRGKALGAYIERAKIVDESGKELDLSKVNTDGTVSDAAQEATSDDSAE